MPDFTVIEGGCSGGEPPAEAVAREAFAKLIVEILCALAQDDDCGCATTNALIEFVEKAGAADVPIAPLIGETISEFHRTAFRCESTDECEAETKRVLEAALRVIVEYFAGDAFAKGRRSPRLDDLRNAIEAQLLGREQRSRERGLTYLKNLSDRLSKRPPRKK